MNENQKKHLKIILKNISNVLMDQKAYLTKLDGEMGDGDLGITMSKGFQCLYDEFDKIEADDFGTLFMKLGMTMNANVPSTMGTLISICLLRAGKTVKGKNKITLEDTVKMGRAAIEGVMEKGNTKIGDKTMLDALYPAIESLQESVNEQLEVKEAVQKAYERTSEGVKETKKLKSVHGRAAYYREKSIGRPDSGATAIMFIFEGIKESF